MPRSSRLRTEQTRRSILVRAVDLASVEGLDGLSIGRLAESLTLSKSGLFAHFGSKQELQLAVIDAARETFEAAVLDGADAVPEGLARLLHLARRWLASIRDTPWRGGCFFAAIASEVDDRPGRVRDRVVELTGNWVARLEGEAAAAIHHGDLEADADPGQVAFEIHAFLQEANGSFQLHGDPVVFRRAATAMHRTLATVATERGMRVLAEQDPAA